MSASLEQMRARIDGRDLVVGIMGLGYVGLPMAMIAVEAGYTTIGFDIDTARVEQINRGVTGIRHIDGAALLDPIATGRFQATADMARLAEADAILIAVPTPLNRNREPDLSYVADSAKAIAATLRPGQLVVLESTSWPGTTTEIVHPILAESGLTAGQDYFVGFSPEREDPGNASFDTRTIPKVVGADDEGSLDLMVRLYGSLVNEVVPVRSSATAEAVKLTENIFRSVNIALVNELKLIFEKMDVDVWDVIEAAKSKPFGFMPFYPGPGLGGHCIPIDPFYLSWRAREFEVATRFIELAGEINTAMPRHVIARLTEALDRSAARGLNGARLLIIGMAYKRNVDDMRESPSLKLWELAQERGASVDYHDPFIAVLPPTRAYPHLSDRRSQPLSAESLAGYDAVIVSTDHDTIDWRMIAEHAKLIIDTRNVFARANIAADHIVKA